MKRDNIIFDIIEKEHQRQLKGIELIASENFVSDQVMQAMGSCLTNKYAEGYPGKRYYGGCEVVDQSETIAIERSRISGSPESRRYILRPKPGTRWPPFSRFSCKQFWYFIPRYRI